MMTNVVGLWSLPHNSAVWAVTKPGVVGRESKKIKIESPDDLFKAGLPQDKIDSLDLYIKC